MRDLGGFEGNAQSLRLLSKTIYSGSQERRGMNPTRALMDGVQKYKRLLREDRAADNHFLYDDQEFLRQFTAGPAILDAGLDYTKLRSLECQIMDWADDTAYGLSDIVDSINAGFLRFERVEDWAANQSLKPDEQKPIDTVLSAIKERKVEARFSRKIGAFIRATSLVSRTGPLSDVSQRYRFSLVVEPEVRTEVDIYKRLCRDLVFRHSQLHQLERKARMILEAIFRAFAEAYLEAKNPSLRLLPDSYDRLVRNADGELGRARVLCDYVAGMTDLFATRTYKRLFDASFGSTVDL
jgi:dGTPase